MKNLLAFLTTYKTKKAQLDMLEEEVEAMKKELVAYASGKYPRDEKGKIKFTHGQYVITISLVKRSDIDKTTLKEKYPDIAKELATSSEYDRVSVK